MSSFSYWPYDEVSLDAQAPDQLTVKTPWLEATTSSAAFNPLVVSDLRKKLRDKSLTADDVGIVSDFFRHFHQYPLAYILPQAKTLDGLDQHSIEDRTLIIRDFDSILTTILHASKDFTDDEIRTLFSSLPRSSFEWDVDAALDFASFDHRVHPESLFSIARRFHILETLTNDRGNEIFNEVNHKDSDNFVDAVARLVRQNHYVTEQCQQALNPARAKAGRAAPIIEDFMSQERGHDKILRKSLLHLGKNPEDIEVTVQTRALMAILRYLATHNFLAFAMAVDAFERNNYEDTDPLANLLNQGGFDRAASFINLHMKINDEGEHENIAQQFLQYMDLFDRDYGLEALRLMEILSVVMCTVSASAKVE